MDRCEDPRRAVESRGNAGEQESRAPRTWSGRDWAIEITSSEIVVTAPSDHFRIPATDASRVAVRRRWRRWEIHHKGRPPLRLRGISDSEATALKGVLTRLAWEPEIADVVRWHADLTQMLVAARAEQRWIAVEDLDAMVSRRPGGALPARVRAAKGESLLSDSELDAMRVLEADLSPLVAAVNEEITVAELSSRQSFFDTIEKTPLTHEQARAVVCFDNRVQLLAAAGSGKTSVMVARAAYAVSRGFVQPDRILLLAFNKAAASELQERVVARFAAAGIDSSGVRATTFHAFGLDLIGRATGQKPRPAAWLEQGEDIKMIVRIVEHLRETSPGFRYRWNLYRMLFATAPIDLDLEEPDAYDGSTRSTGYRTFAGEVVKSHGERLIANFLFLNGIDYVYERPYSVPVADAAHSQYRPDFYYPSVDVWHEHWALDRNGKPPDGFPNYLAQMAWKRQIHEQHGTRLLETSWAEVMFGDGLARLERELTELGLKFDWNPNRPIAGRETRAPDDKDLARTVRTFMTHVKSSSATRQTLEDRMTSSGGRLSGFRTRLFLELYWHIHAEWENRLAADNSVDFEDMIVKAACLLEEDRVQSEYDLILVDEFQDVSRARARLIRGLVNAPGRYLLAVGDDWQSINRFAGADLSVMREFESWFGRGPRLAITTTFRCTQTVCDVARAFVARNPHQFDKPMRSAQRDPGPQIAVLLADDLGRTLSSHLADLSAAASAGRIPLDHTEVLRVDVLGRYGFERDLLPTDPPGNLRVSFRTVHSSKGLEADHIVVVGLRTGTYGFPSTIADDPVLDLAMPTPDTYPHAEERRLFYVALTRSRYGVTLIAPRHQVSPFVLEVLAIPGAKETGEVTAPIKACPQCGKGTMVKRTGRYGSFLGCSEFPACSHTQSLKSSSHVSGPRKRRH